MYGQVNRVENAGRETGYSTVGLVSVPCYGLILQRYQINRRLPGSCTVQDQAVSSGNTQARAPDRAGKGLLALGGVGALLASTCCVLPFVLVILGLGGAWLSGLHALYPYRWIFIGGAATALFFAWRRLYRPQTECAGGGVCAVPAVRRSYRVLFWLIATLVALTAVAPYILAGLLG